MGFFSWLLQRFIRTDNENQENASAERTVPNLKAFKTHTSPGSVMAHANRDFFYGILFGAFKNDFDSIKSKLQTIHSDMSENHHSILGHAEKTHSELLGVLGEHRSRLGQLIEQTEKQLRQAQLPAAFSKDIRRNIQTVKHSLRQAEVYQIVQQNIRVTAKQIASQLRIAENTATEHLRNLEKLGSLVRERRGVYRVP